MLKPYLAENRREAGCDEAGRGCLAGPVFAAAVVLPPDFFHKELNDSKQLSERQRDMLRIVIEQEALSWAVAEVSAGEIDQINILNASFLGMHRALDKLESEPEALLIDGNRFKKYRQVPHHCIVKGDATFFSIAAASVLAKTYRDEFMSRIHQEFPAYSWHKNKGYPTAEHRSAIAQHGPSPYHRMSFQLLPNDGQGELF
jgi:ribonuclease HII